MRAVLLFMALVVVAPAVVAQNGTVGDGTEGNVTADPGPPRVLDRWDNPLGPPLDNEYGVFLLDVALWVAIGLVVMLVVAPALKALTIRTPTDIDRHIVGIVSKPGFILVFTYGLVDSLSVLPVPGWVLVTLDRIWSVVLILVIAYIVHRVWHEILLEVGESAAAKSESQLDDRLYPLFDKLGGVVIWIVAVWLVVSSFGINMTLFAAGGAVGGLIIAFAAQDTLGNLFAGIFLLLDQPFREGDRIEIKDEDTWGDVVEIGLRTTRIRTRDNRMVIVPNSLIASNSIINHAFPDSAYRFESRIGIAYGSDVEAARTAMREAVEDVPGLLPGRDVDVLFAGFGDSALNFRVRYWLGSYADVRRIEDAVNTALDRALADAGIEIPFPQRVVHLQKEAAERRGPSPGGA